MPLQLVSSRALRLCALLSIPAALMLAALPSGSDGNDGDAELAGLTVERRAADRHSTELGNAWAHFQRSEIMDALELFERVAGGREATAADRVQALFGIGLCRSHRRPFPDRTGAEAAFREILERYPADATAPWALIELGNLVNVKAAGHPGAAAARARFEEVLSKYPDSLAVHEAALRLANSLFYELEPPHSTAALQLLEDHLARHPENPLATIMLFRLDYWYSQILQQYERALPFAVELSQRKMSDPFRWSRQYWHTAEIYRLALNQPGQAIPWYRKIVEETPNSIHTLSAKQMIERYRGTEATP